MMAMNRLGDAWKLDLENRDKPLTSFANAYRAWDDFTTSLESDLKRRHLDSFGVIFEKTLPTFERFQAWFYWQRNQLVNIEAVDRLAKGDALFRKKYLSSPETVEESDRLDGEGAGR